MLFSILIAHYNNYNYFLDCYKSILAQEYQNFEVIIVDDCSTDDSFEKLQELLKSDNRFRLYRNDENEGVGYTKRRCVDLANGDVCGFVDPDDALLPNAIEESAKIYRNNPDAIATYSKFHVCDQDLVIQKIFPHSRKVDTSSPYFFNVNFEVAHFFTFKRDAYFSVGGIVEEYKVAEDQDLYLKLSEKGKFYFIPKPLLLYRIHKKGLSHDESKVKLRNETWHKVLLKTARRRKIDTLYGRRIDEIDNLPKFILQKQNTFFSRILRKLK